MNGCFTHMLVSVEGVFLNSHGHLSNEAKNGVRDGIKVASSVVDRIKPAAGA